MVQWRQHTVTRDGVNLAAFEYDSNATAAAGADDRPTALLVHGWPDTHDLWTHVAPLLAEHVRVVAYDTRGYGDSSSPHGVAAYRLPELADDLFAVAEAVSPGRPVHVIAHDWGSVQSWEAVTTPGAERFIASFLSVSGPNLDYLSWWARKNLSRPTPRNLANSVAQVGSSSYTAFFQMPLLPKLFFSAVGSPRIWQEFIHRVEGTARENVVVGPTFRQDLISGLRYYRANIRPKLRNPDPRPTTIPVLELINRGDIALRPAIFDDTYLFAAKLWRRESPTGHWLPFSNPGYLADSAIEFITAIDQGDAAENAAEPNTLERARAAGKPLKFTGKLAVITGAGSGIGRETAYALAELGCEVIAADINAETAEQTAKECRTKGVGATAYQLDVADTAAFLEFADTVTQRHGVADIVINNAGIGLAGAVLDATDEQIRQVVDVNVHSVMTGSRAFGQRMVDRGLGGQIVNVASGAAFTPQRAFGIYSATKAAVLLFSESLRAELHEHGIGVSAICPGVVDTNIISNTEFAGFGDSMDDERERVNSVYRRRNFGPEKAARDIIRAIVRNRAVVPVTPEAKFGYRVYRLTPWLSRWAARQQFLSPLPKKENSL